MWTRHLARAGLLLVVAALAGPVAAQVTLPAPSLPYRVIVVATAYSSTVGQTDQTPWVGRCGRVYAGTVAVSRDLLRLIDCGKRVRLFVQGQRFDLVVWDTMAADQRWRVDIWMSSTADAIRWGRRPGLLEWEW